MITTLLSLVFSSSLLFAQVDVPKVEAVPSPEVEHSSEIAGKTEGKVQGSMTGVEPADMALIKSGKKSCHKVDGKLKCMKTSKIKQRRKHK